MPSASASVQLVALYSWTVMPSPLQSSPGTAGQAVAHGEPSSQGLSQAPAVQPLAQLVEVVLKSQTSAVPSQKPVVYFTAWGPEQ